MASRRRRHRSNSSGPERRSSRGVPLRRSVTHASSSMPTLYVLEHNSQVFAPSPLRETKRASVQPYPAFVGQGHEFGFYAGVDPNGCTPRFPGIQPSRLPQYGQDEFDSGAEDLSEVDIDEATPSRTNRPDRRSGQANNSRMYTDSPSKFTHKWPPLRGLDDSVKSAGSRVLHVEGDALPPPAAPSLEEGRRRIYPHFGSGKWTMHKSVLMVSVIILLLYALAGLVYAVMTWFNAWDKAVVMTVADMDVLTVITLTAALMLFTSLIGITGTLLDSRSIVAVYAILLWPCFICLLSVGYVSYKRVTFSLDYKLNLSWSRYYTKIGRLFIQDSLGCCGFYGALHDTTPSTRCYLRTPLPGCKAMLYDFESRNLRFIWQGAFALVPVHLMNVIVALLCANHITEVFGRGMMPKQYRLSALDVKEDAHRILGTFNGKHIEEVGYAKLPPS